MLGSSLRQWDAVPVKFPCNICSTYKKLWSGHFRSGLIFYPFFYGHTRYRGHSQSGASSKRRGFSGSMARISAKSITALPVKASVPFQVPASRNPSADGDPKGGTYSCPHSAQRSARRPCPVQLFSQWCPCRPWRDKL